MSDSPPSRPRRDHRAPRRSACRRAPRGAARLALARAAATAVSRLNAGYPAARPSPRGAFRRYWV